MTAYVARVLNQKHPKTHSSRRSLHYLLSSAVLKLPTVPSPGDSHEHIPSSLLGPTGPYWTPTATNTSVCGAGLRLLKRMRQILTTQEENATDLVLGKSRVTRLRMCHKLTLYGPPKIVTSISNTPDPTDPWAHVHNPAKRSGTERTPLPCTCAPHTRAAAAAAAKFSLVVPFGRLLLLRVLFLLLLLPLATFLEPC